MQICCKMLLLREKKIFLISIVSAASHYDIIIEQKQFQLPVCRMKYPADSFVTS